MPIYEYRCTSCGRTLEVIQKVSDKALKKCTECSGPLEKLISRSAFQLKGGGWYSEGYGSQGGSSTSSTTDSGTKSEKTKKSETPGDTGSSGGKKAAAGGCASGGCGCH